MVLLFIIPCVVGGFFLARWETGEFAQFWAIVFPSISLCLWVLELVRIGHVNSAGIMALAVGAAAIFAGWAIGINFVRK